LSKAIIASSGCSQRFHTPPSKTALFHLFKFHILGSGDGRWIYFIPVKVGWNQGCGSGSESGSGRSGSTLKKEAGSGSELGSI